MSPSAAYSACMALAVVTAALLRRPSTLPRSQQWGLWIGAIAGSAIGAKLPFVLLAGEGLLGVRAKTGDGWVVPLAGALAVGRWGCFFKG